MFFSYIIQQRKDIRSIITREICVNLLIHRECSNPFPAKLISEGGSPELIENDIFRTNVPIDYQEYLNKTGQEKYEKLNDTQVKILEIIKNNNEITQAELQEKLKMGRTVITDGLKENGYIEREGSDRKGYWKVNKKVFLI